MTIHISSVPNRVLSFASKYWHHITTTEKMETQDSSQFFWPSYKTDLMNGNPFHVCPWPKAIHSLESPSSFKDGKNTIITITAASFALIIKTLLPFRTEFLACTNIDVSVSTRVQGDTLFRCITWLDSALSTLRTTIVFVVWTPTVSSARNWKTCFVYVVSQKVFPILGCFSEVCHPPPHSLPLLCSCSAFRLDGK